MPFERLAEQRLRQAIEDGLLDDLPNRGEPLDLEEYFATPEHLRAMRQTLETHVRGPKPSVETIEARLGALSAGATAQLRGEMVLLGERF